LGQATIEQVQEKDQSVDAYAGRASKKVFEVDQPSERECVLGSTTT
jgi:hypothetical protein